MVKMEKKLRYTKMAIAFLALLFLITSIWFWQEYKKNTDVSYEAGYQAGYEAAQEEAKTTREPSQSGTVQSYTYVYVTKSGEKYHTETCRYAENAEAITLGEAIEKGYAPCSVCNPPRG